MGLLFPRAIHSGGSSMTPASHRLTRHEHASETTADAGEGPHIRAQIGEAEAHARELPRWAVLTNRGNLKSREVPCHWTKLAMATSSIETCCDRSDATDGVRGRQRKLQMRAQAARCRELLTSCGKFIQSFMPSFYRKAANLCTLRLLACDSS